MNRKWDWESICALLLLPHLLQAAIIQTASMEDVLEFVDESTVVFFDIDDTLISCEAHVGRSEFYWHGFTNAVASGAERSDAHQLVQNIWRQVCDTYPPCFMQPGMMDVVDQIKEKALFTMGLTARSPRTYPITREQFEILGLEFTTTSPDVFLKETSAEILYSGGVISVGATPKGYWVRKWLDELTSHPLKIMLIDDRHQNLIEMEMRLADLPIEFTGIHYTNRLEHDFDLDIAELQYELLEPIHKLSQLPFCVFFRYFADHLLV